jgi:C-8 sterol isomerase
MGYIFNPDALHEIARKRMSLPHQEMVQAIIDDVAELWPGHVERRPNWFFNLAGGAIGTMTLLHVSLREYVIIYGSPIGTIGFSGRHRLEIWDYVLTGEMACCTEDNFCARVAHPPGDAAHLRKGQVKGYRLQEGTWMLEYARGWTLPSLPMGVGDAIFSCADLRILGKTLWQYSKLVGKELLRGKI